MGSVLRIVRSSRIVVIAAFATALALPSVAAAGRSYVLGNVNKGIPHVTAGPNGVYDVVWNDDDATVFHYCQVHRGQSGCAISTAIGFGNEAEHDTAPGAGWIVRGAAPGLLYLVNAQYVSSKTYIWTSTNNGASFSGPVKIWGGQTSFQGTDSKRPLLFPANNSIAFPVVNPSLNVYDVKIDGANAAQEEKATLEQEALGIRGYNLGLATLENATLATADNLDNIYAWAVPNGGDLNLSSSWGSPFPLFAGYNSSLAGAGTDTFISYTVGPGGGQRVEVRRWTGTAFSKPKVVDKDPFSNSVLSVSEHGRPGVVYDNGSGLGYSSSADKGTTYTTKTVTRTKDVFFDLDMAHDDDGHGLAVWTRNGAIAAADLTEVADPSIPAVSKTVTKNGRTIGLNVPGSCVVPGKKFNVSTGGQGVGKLDKVTYSFAGTKTTDTKSPWGATLKTPSNAKLGDRLFIKAVNYLSTKKGNFTITITSSVDVCGG